MTQQPPPLPFQSPLCSVASATDTSTSKVTPCHYTDTVTVQTAAACRAFRDLALTRELTHGDGVIIRDGSVGKVTWLLARRDAIHS